MKISAMLCLLALVLPVLGSSGEPAAASEAAAPEAASPPLGEVLRSGEFSGPITGRALRHNIYRPRGWEGGQERCPLSYFLHDGGRNHLFTLLRAGDQDISCRPLDYAGSLLRAAGGHGVELPR